jgi:general secretion pathway protein G
MTGDLEVLMKYGWAKIDGDNAEVSIHGRPVFYLVRANGDWKIDYDQTRKVVPSGMTPSDIDQTIAREQMLQDVTADMIAGKFKTFAEVTARLAELDSSFPMQPQAHYAIANTPLDAVNAYIRAMNAGDADAMFNRLVFVNEDSRREAVAVDGLRYATERYLAVAAEMYGSDVPPVDLTEAAATAQALRQEVQGATLKVEGDLAELTALSGDAIYLHRIDGDWKIDFDLLEKQDLHRYSRQEIDARCARYQAEMDMVGEMRSGRFPTFAAANAELEKRVMDAMGGPVAAARRAAIAQIGQIRSAVMMFNGDNARFPTKDEGLQALVAPPQGLENTWHKLYDRLPKDPWGNDFQYAYPLQNVSPPFSVISAGPDGQFGTDDDIDQDTQE